MPKLAIVLAPAPSESADLTEFRDGLRSGQPEAHLYAALLGLRSYEPMRLYEHVRRGLSYSAFGHLQRNTALPVRALAELAEIPTRTLARRKDDGRFEPEESDRLLRVARVFGRALALFEGDAEGARHWLAAEQPALGGMVPLALARTDVGAREVDQLIGRLEYGIPA
jgi:putative toxin-antitoxin system antitoxin component (TIGR02293 family)